MRVFVLRGEGPSGRAEALGRLDIESLGDADAAIELLQEQATRLDTNAVIRVRIVHEPEGRIRITGLAVRYI